MDWLIDDFWDLVARILGLSEDLLTTELKTFVLFAIAIGIVGLGFGQVLGRARGRLTRDSLREQLKNAFAREKILSQQVEAAQDKQTVSDLKASGVEQQLVRYIGRVRAAVEGQLLTRPYSPESPPPWQKGSQSRIPVIAIANLKGGVGKTTLAANLGAYFADSREIGPQHKKKVLFIDLDFQGSLSETLVHFSGGENFSRSERIFDPAAQVSLLWQDTGVINHSHMTLGCRFFDCDFDASRREDRLLLDWAIDPSADLVERPREPCPRCGLDRSEHMAPRDPRLSLANLLYHPSIQKNFDLVLLDLPPRNTLFAFNALAAATHLIVPTRPDDLSNRAVSRLFSFLESHRTGLWPGLEALGVVGMMTDEAKLKPHERSSLEAAIEDANSVWGRPSNQIRLLGHVATKAAITQIAARDFAYFKGQANEASSPHVMFRTVGDSVSKALNMAHGIAETAT